jgi:hypothetical protein
MRGPSTASLLQPVSIPSITSNPSSSSSSSSSSSTHTPTPPTLTSTSSSIPRTLTPSTPGEAEAMNAQACVDDDLPPTDDEDDEEEARRSNMGPPPSLPPPRPSSSAGQRQQQQQQVKIARKAGMGVNLGALLDTQLSDSDDPVHDSDSDAFSSDGGDNGADSCFE